MTGFEDVPLKWAGAEYTLRARGMMEAIRDIEDTLRGPNGRQVVDVLTQPGGPGIATLCMAYSRALRHAGARVTPDEIYNSIYQGVTDQSGEILIEMQEAIMTLMRIVAPPLWARFKQEMEREDDGPGEDEAAA